MVTMHVLISGKVQQVGFRHFTRRNAERLGLTGWVKNLRDGRVEAVIQGEQEQVNQLLKHLHNGPAVSTVENVKTEELTGEEENEYPSFRVRY